jgi:Tfp pilus assembly protein PilE
MTVTKQYTFFEKVSVVFVIALLAIANIPSFTTIRGHYRSKHRDDPFAFY